MSEGSISSIPAIKHIVFFEVFESFSYYGLRSILALFLVRDVGLDQRDATTAIHSFIFLTCLFSLINGFASDACCGKYRMILYCSFVYLGGITILTSSAYNHPAIHRGDGIAEDYDEPVAKTPAWLSFLGLFLVAAGVGGINPCLSTFVGDQFKSGFSETLLSSLYHVFYLSVNIGSILSFFCIPLIRDRLGVAAAFAIPTGLFVLAIVVFFLGQKHYTIAQPRKNPLPELWAVYTTALREREDAEKRGVFVGHTRLLDFAKPVHGQQAVESLRAVLGVLRVFTPLPVFWALYDQQTSRWVFMAQKMNRKVGNYIFAPDQLNTLNPFLLLLLIPVFEHGIYPGLRRCGFKMRPLARMGVGMLLTAASFFYAGALQHAIDVQGYGRVSIGYMIPQYLLLSCGEIMLSITGLEFAYSQSPNSVKSVVMSIWFTTAAIGNLLVTLVSRQTFATQVQEFYFYAAVMTVFFFIFVLIACSYRYQNNFGEAPEEDLYARVPGRTSLGEPRKTAEKSSRKKRHHHHHHHHYHSANDAYDHSSSSHPQQSQQQQHQQHQQQSQQQKHQQQASSSRQGRSHHSSPRHESIHDYDEHDAILTENPM